MINNRYSLVITVFLLTVALLASCDKQEKTYEKSTTTISGYVYDVVTDEALPNVKLRLRADSRGGSHFLSSFEQVLDSTYSDSTGYYEFIFSCTPDAPYGSDAYANYGVEHVQEHYWKSPNMFLPTFDCEQNNLDRGNVSIIPLTWIKVHIKNEAPYMATDSIYYYGPSDESTYPDPPRWKFGLPGQFVDTLFYITIKANGVPLHYWDVTENGITTRSAAYLGCNPLDTCELNIFY